MESQGPDVTSGVTKAPSGSGGGSGGGSTTPSVSVPPAINATTAQAVALVVTGAPGANVSYSFTEGSSTLNGTGVIASNDTFAVVVNLSSFPDGVIGLTVTETGGGAPTTTLTASISKNSVPPPAPTVTAPADANNMNDTAFNVTIKGQAGAFADVEITDSATGEASGGDVIPASGTLVVPVDVSFLLDGTLTIAVTLTNGAGDSTTTTLNVTKNTVAPVLTVSTIPANINASNVSSWSFNGNADKFDTVAYSFTDGATTLTGSASVNGNMTWTFSPNLSTLKDGPVTLTITATNSSARRRCSPSTWSRARSCPRRRRSP